MLYSLCNSNIKTVCHYPLCNSNIKNVRRGDYDNCRVPLTQQLSSLEVGEDNSKFEPKKFKSINMVKQRGVIGVFRHAESISGLCFVLTLLLQRFLATFMSKHKTVFAGFP